MIEVLFSFILIVVTILMWNVRKAEVPIAFKMFMVAIVMIMTVGSYQVYNDLLGAPIKGYPSEEFKLIHYTVETNEQGQRIYLWLKIEDENKLYSFPFNSDVAKKLDDMKKQGERGVPIRGEFSITQTPSERNPSVDLRTHRLDGVKLYDKNADENLFR